MLGSESRPWEGVRCAAGEEDGSAIIWVTLDNMVSDFPALCQLSREFLALQDSLDLKNSNPSNECAWLSNKMIILLSTILLTEPTSHCRGSILAFPEGFAVKDDIRHYFSQWKLSGCLLPRIVWVKVFLCTKRIKRGIHLSSTSHALFHACVWCLESQQPLWDLEGEAWRQSQKAENRLESAWVHPHVVWAFESALSSPNYLQTFVTWDNRKSCFESSFSSKGGPWTNHINKIQNVLKQQNLGQYPRNAESESAC